MSDHRPVFISYRRGDEPGYTGWLYQILADELGAAAVFKDIEGGFRDGDDFPDELTRRVREADILLAVIGPNWLTSTTENGHRRLDNPEDWVRIEIRAALAQEKRVIPLLVNGASYLKSEDLPEDIQPLARKQVRRLTNERFAPEAKVLVAGLKDLLVEAEMERKDAARRAAAEAERRAAEEAARLREEEDHRREEEARMQAEEELRRADEENRQRAAAEEAERLATAALTPEALEEAKEFANWDYVKGRAEIAALRDHLSRYSDGPTSGYAHAELERLVWARTDLASDSDLTAYLNEFADGPEPENAATAQRLLTERAEAQAESERQVAVESQAWDDLEMTDRSAVKAFLREFPDGAHADSARMRLRELGRVNRRYVVIGAGAAVFGGLGTWQMREGGVLWKATMGRNIHTFSPRSRQDFIAYLPDGKTILTAGIFPRLHFWDIETGELLRDPGIDEPSRIDQMALSPDGESFLVATGFHKNLELRDLASTEIVWKYSIPDVDWRDGQKISSIEFSPDGQRFIAHDGNALFLWDVETGKRLHGLEGSSLRFLPDGKSLLTGGMKLIDVETGKVHHESADESESFPLAIAPDGNTVAAFDRPPRSLNPNVVSRKQDPILQILDIQTGEVLRVFASESHSAEPISTFSFSPDGARAVTTGADEDTTWVLWDVASGEILHRFHGHTGGVFKLRYAPDEATVLSASWDGTVKLWDVTSL